MWVERHSHRIFISLYLTYSTLDSMVTNTRRTFNVSTINCKLFSPDVINFLWYWMLDVKLTSLQLYIFSTQNLRYFVPYVHVLMCRTFTYRYRKDKYWNRNLFINSLWVKIRRILVSRWFKNVHLLSIRVKKVPLDCHTECSSPVSDVRSLTLWSGIRVFL